MPLNNHPTAWQKLLSQALKDTRIKTSQAGYCNLFNIRQFIYQSFQNCGIQNRSPFSIRQLISIKLASKGQPQQVRELCIKAILNMEKPSFCLLSSNTYLVSFIIILSLVTLITPITATTFKTSNTTQSILKIKTLPWQDLENESISIPSTTDYLSAAIETIITTDEKQQELNGIAWILNQKDTAYGLQILSVSKKSKLIDFCQKHEICNESAFYSTTIKGKKIVRLIYQSYSSHKAAKLAKVKLPESLKRSSPWARSFKQIKDEL